MPHVAPGNETDIFESDEESILDDKPVDDNPLRETAQPRETGGRGGLDPTRYGDWEKAGRCIDF